MSEEEIHLSVDGREFAVRPRPDEPGVYDFSWLNGPYGQGFSSKTSDGSPMSREGLADAIRDYFETCFPD